MAKASGSTRASGPAPSTAAMTYEQQVDNALVGLKAEFFDRMQDFYDNQYERFKVRFADYKEKNDLIWGDASSMSAPELDRREREAYGSAYRPYGHSKRGDDLHQEYSDLIVGGLYNPADKAPTWYDIKKGRNNVDEAARAVKATATRNAEKKFAQVRDKMLKTTLDKGIDTKKARVRSVGGDGFLIDDGKVTLHARYILAWGEIKAPHFRFIITDRKS